MKTIYLFKAFADIFMMMPLTLWTGDAKSFMATVFLYSISNGVEFYDLALKEEVQAFKTTYFTVCLTILAVAALAIISASCVMGYLDLSSLNDKSVIQIATKVGEHLKIISPENSVFHIPAIKYKWVLYLGLFPIAAHIMIAVSTYINSKTTKFSNKYVN